ncbi:hypothetical protein STEG23_017412 [Scotinomys teguina]
MVITKQVKKIRSHSREMSDPIFELFIFLKQSMEFRKAVPITKSREFESQERKKEKKKRQKKSLSELQTGLTQNDLWDQLLSVTAVMVLQEQAGVLQMAQGTGTGTSSPAEGPQRHHLTPPKVPSNKDFDSDSSLPWNFPKSRHCIELMFRDSGPDGEEEESQSQNSEFRR